MDTCRSWAVAWEGAVERKWGEGRCVWLVIFAKSHIKPLGKKPVFNSSCAMESPVRGGGCQEASPGLQEMLSAESSFSAQMQAIPATPQLLQQLLPLPKWSQTAAQSKGCSAPCGTASLTRDQSHIAQVSWHFFQLKPKDHIAFSFARLWKHIW